MSWASLLKEKPVLSSKLEKSSSKLTILGKSKKNKENQGKKEPTIYVGYSKINKEKIPLNTKEDFDSYLYDKYRRRVFYENSFNNLDINSTYEFFYSKMAPRNFDEISDYSTDSDEEYFSGD